MTREVLLTNTLDLIEYLKTNRTYVVSSYLGKFVYPIGHKVDTILTVYTKEDIGIVPPRITNSGVSIRYTIQEAMGISFLLGCRIELFSRDYEDSKIIHEALGNVKVERFTTASPSTYKDVYSRNSLLLSPNTLFGMLMIRSVRELVSLILSEKDDGGELLLYAYDKPNCKRIYKIVNTSNHAAVLFSFIDFPHTKLLKNLGSINSYAININSNLDTEFTIDVSRISNQSETRIANSILAQAGEVFNTFLGGN